MYRHKTTIEQWRIFQAVVDFGGYAHAAERLNKSQSSLNHAVSKLQNQLGVQLLEVVGRKAMLTDAGEVMLRRSRYITQNIEDLEDLAANIRKQWEPEITLAADLAFPRDYLFKVMKQFLPQSRGSRLKVIDSVLTGSEEAITEHWADLVITHSVPKGFLGEPISLVNFVLVCHPHHELTKLNSPFDPSALTQHLQLVIKDTAQTPTEKQGWLKSELRWTVSQFHSAIELLKSGIGFCWLPEHTVIDSLADGTLVKLSVKGSSFRKITSYLVVPSPDNAGPGTRLLEKLFIDNRQIDVPDAQ